MYLLIPMNVNIFDYQSENEGVIFDNMNKKHDIFLKLSIKFVF